MFSKYKKLPVEISAVQLHDDNIVQIVDIINKESTRTATMGPGEGEVEILTLEGAMTAKPLDYIIRGINGEYYPCKPDK